MVRLINSALICLMFTGCVVILKGINVERSGTEGLHIQSDDADSYFKTDGDSSCVQKKARRKLKETSSTPVNKID